jgi:ribonuclease HI
LELRLNFSSCIRFRSSVRAVHLHTAYVQKLTSIPFHLIQNSTPTTRSPNLNVYLVSNEKALALLNRTHILTTLPTTITKLTGKTAPTIHLNLDKKDPQQIDSHTSYTDPYPNIPKPTKRTQRLPLKPFRATWNPNSFIYTDGSPKTGNPKLRASIVNPQTQITTHIEIKSQPERYTINTAELAAIAVALDLHKDATQIQILTDSTFSINTLRYYAIDPLRYVHHPHKDLLHQADAIIKKRDETCLLTHIGKVKSHT